MKISVKYEGDLSDLSLRHPTFKKLRSFEIPKTEQRRWSRNGGAQHSYDVQTIFIGKTGYGKSTTVNAFFGDSIMGTSEVHSCTREAQSFEFKIKNEHFFSLADLPGIGESAQKDKEYLSLYSNLIEKTDVVIYILRADSRDYSIDETVCNHLFPKGENIGKAIFALNFCDKIEPLSRAMPFIPSAKQIENIDQKITSIKNIFKPSNNIIPYSADTNWNLGALADEITRVISLSPDLSKY